MLKIERINTSHEHYPFVEALMQAAFPLQERRDIEWQRTITDHNPLFHNNLISDDNIPIGLLTFWDFKDFHYIEHFAISEEFRNKGYGQQVLSLLKREIKNMIILEAEEPVDEITRRRISFYQRQGFTLQEVPYQQPPYREGDGWFPMKLLTLNDKAFPSLYETVRNTIYQEVYKFKFKN